MHRHEDIGFWKVIRCSKPMASICEFPRQGYTEPPTTTTTIRPEAQCPSYEWIKYNDNCYRFDSCKFVKTCNLTLFFSEHSKLIILEMDLGMALKMQENFAKVRVEI